MDSPRGAESVSVVDSTSAMDSPSSNSTESPEWSQEGHGERGERELHLLQAQRRKLQDLAKADPLGEEEEEEGEDGEEEEVEEVEEEEEEEVEDGEEEEKAISTTTSTSETAAAMETLETILPAGELLWPALDLGEVLGGKLRPRIISIVSPSLSPTISSNLSTPLSWTGSSSESIPAPGSSPPKGSVRSPFCPACSLVSGSGPLLVILTLHSWGHSWDHTWDHSRDHSWAQGPCAGLRMQHRSAAFAKQMSPPTSPQL